MFNMTDEEMTTIKKYLLGGAALGGSAALATSLVNYLQKIKKREEERTDMDDDTIYVYKKKASLSNGIAMAGGLLSTVASYLAVKKLYQKFREAEAQKELDDAQHIFIDESGYKEAAWGEKDRRGMNFWGGVAGLPFAIPLVLALAGGVTVNSILKSQFPEKKETIKAPKRIEVLDASDFEDEEKKASVDPDAQEFVCRMALLNPVEHSQLQSIQKVAALGGHEAFKDTAMQLGIVPALSIVKGASSKHTDPVNDHIALCWMNKCAYLQPSIGLIAAGEFTEAFPHACNRAAMLDEETQHCLYKIASLMGRAFRSEMTEELGLLDGSKETFSKQASSTGNEESILSRVLSGLNVKKNESEEQLVGAEPVTDGDENESSEISGDLAGNATENSNSRPSAKKKEEFIGSSKTLRLYRDGETSDFIDKLLSPGK